MTLPWTCLWFTAILLKYSWWRCQITFTIQLYNRSYFIFEKFHVFDPVTLPTELKEISTNAIIISRCGFERTASYNLRYRALLLHFPLASRVILWWWYMYLNYQLSTGPVFCYDHRGLFSWASKWPMEL